MGDATTSANLSPFAQKDLTDRIVFSPSQTGNWDTSVDFNLVDDILERAYALNPALGHHKGLQAIQIIGHNVGLRPSRRGGPRLEAEKVEQGTVVHAYGIGSAGFQASYGMASDVLGLVEAAGGKEAKRQARL